MKEMSKQLHNDVATLQKIPAILNILEVICGTTEMGFAAVARVTETKWIACAVKDKINFGLLPGGELELETTICNEIRQQHNTVIIDHVAEDELFRDHHTPAIYGFQSYISVPIILKNGDLFGTLCAIDPAPHRLNTPEIRDMFNLFAELIAFHLDALKKIDLAEKNLLKEQETAMQRDKFISILAHDLRNPIGASLNAAQLLMRLPLDDKVKRLSKVVFDASNRVNGLIENTLDFARGRFGAGIPVEKKQTESLQETLKQVIRELKLVHTDAVINADLAINCVVDCDERRLAQLFSNILGNALMHGEKGTPIEVNAEINENVFRLRVSNQGEKIPSQSIRHLFKPFHKGEAKSGKKGLGLGLYISQEIAKAHHGKIIVSSSHEKTCFSLEIPC